MVKIASVVFSLALMVLSIQFVARGTDSKTKQEKAFHAGIENALVQMENFGFFDKDMKSELGKVDFHQAYEDAKSKESNEKAVFVATFRNTMDRLTKSGAIDRSVYDNLFPGGGKNLSPELELALGQAYEDAKHYEGGSTKHDL